MKPALDFSILDEKQPIKMPVDAPKSKTTEAAKNAPQATAEALQGIQASKVEISQGIRVGSDPYPLLLKAVQLLSILTGERDFYTIHRDVMQGMGMLEKIPAAWERDSVNASLQKLEASRQNIDAAITAHKQWLDGQPISGDMDTDSEYDRRIKKCFGVAYKFLDEHKHARTDEDWERIVGSVAPYTDPFTVDLITAVIGELEREYKEAVEPPMPS